MLVLNRAPTAGGVLLAALCFVACIALGVVPVAGRTPAHWLPLLGVHLVRRALGRHRFRSLAPETAMRTIGLRVPTSARVLHPPPSPPRTFEGVRVIALPYRGRAVGVVSEHGGRQLTSMLACSVASFSLLDPEAQERRLARWGLVLSDAALTPVRRLQWIERTVPAQGDQLARWLQAERDPSLPPRGTAMVESYLELIATSAAVAQEHEILLAVQVDSRRIRERSEGGAESALLEQTERVAQGLRAAEVTVLGALSPGQIARALRTAFDPFARTELATLEAGDHGRDGVAESSAWPLGAQETWEHYRTDGALHATYWISGWPRVDVSSLFMEALLGHSNAVRTVAVTFEPIPAERSTREVEAAVTRDHADRELRRRFGQSETARQRQAQEATARREAELAAGHSEVRFSGFVTVSGRDEDDLRRASAEVLSGASRSRLELRRMYGEQARAFAFTLPLCRGLA